jgi:hypothetical protein
MNYNPGTGTLSFAPGTVNFVQYFDGLTVTSNGPTETINGSDITILPTLLIGPSSTVSGAFEFEDTFFSIVNGGEPLISGTLADMILFPDSSVPGGSALQGTLTWSGIAVGRGSRYLDERFFRSDEDALSFYSDLLANLSTGGTFFGVVDLNSTSVVPAPATGLFLASGARGLLGFAWAVRRGRGWQKPGELSPAGPRSAPTGGA